MNSVEAHFCELVFVMYMHRPLVGLFSVSDFLKLTSPDQFSDCDRCVIQRLLALLIKSQKSVLNLRQTCKLQHGTGASALTLALIDHGNDGAVGPGTVGSASTARRGSEADNGSPGRGEILKFAEAALFRLAVSQSGKVRSEVRQGRSDARLVRGIWLGKTLDSDEHLFGTDEGVFTTRKVKRDPDSSQRRGDLVKKFQGTPWDRLAGKPVARPRKAPPQATPVVRPPTIVQSLKPSDESSEPMDTDHGGASSATPSTHEHTLGQLQTAASSEPSMQPRSFSQRLHQERHGTASGIKRDARTAELPDENEGGAAGRRVDDS